MDHVVIFEAANDINNRIRLANIGQELIAQALAFARACDESRNIDKFNSGRKNALGFHDRGESAQPWVRHFDNTDIGLDGAKRIVFRRDTRLG